MARKQPARRPPTSRATPPAAPAMDRRLMEQTMNQVTRLLESREFSSMEEANAVIQQLLASGGLPETAPQTPLEAAQEVVYEALEATGKRRVQLAQRALAISPDCADAYVILAEAARSPQEAQALYAQGVAAGERALGPAAFTDDLGHFWGLLETRPYMRARQGLAEVLWAMGERMAAIAHYLDMLRLNPGDNQGIRYRLATWLLAIGDDAALGRLLQDYPDEASATWAYTRALWTYRREGASPAAATAVAQALAVNPYVPLFLLGAKPLPRRLPDYIGMGDENEAVEYVAAAAENWLETPGAMEWFAEVAMTVMTADDNKPPPRAPRAPRRRR